MGTADTIEPKSWRGKHALLGALGASGAVAGSAIGLLLLGPVGAIAGGVVGVVGGLIAGKGLEDEDRRFSMHDREIDDVIGVTKGEIGAREIAASRLSRPSGSLSPGAFLQHDHERIERLANDLISSAKANGTDIAHRWRELEHGLLAHLATEEADLFPGLRQTQRDEVDALLVEHTEIRWLVSRIRAGVASRLVPVGLVYELIDDLRAHATREARVAYPWAEASLSSSFVVDVEMRLDDAHA